MSDPERDMASAPNAIGELSRNVPRSVAWVPILGRWAYRRYTGWKSRRTIEALLRVKPFHATVNVSNAQIGFVRLTLTAANFSDRPVSCRRLSLTELRVGSRGLSRSSEWMVAHGDIGSHSVGELQFHVELRPDEIRMLVKEGIGRAPNPFSGPHADVHASGAFLLYWGKRESERYFNFVFPTDCTVRDEALPSSNH